VGPGHLDVTAGRSASDLWIGDGAVAHVGTPAATGVSGALAKEGWSSLFRSRGHAAPPTTRRAVHEKRPPRTLPGRKVALV